MRATEFLTELFKPGKNWSWSFRGSEEAVADFTVGDREYQWSAFSHTLAKNPTKWEVQFRLKRQETDPEDMSMFGTTGTGNSAEVMSIAVDITREFLKDYGDKVLELTFNAKEDSRSSLYAKMVKRLLPNWNLYKRMTKNDGLEFHLTNPRAYDLTNTP